MNTAQRQQLRTDLKQLEKELEDIDSINSEDRQMLLRIQTDIAAALKREQEREQHFNGLSESLHEAVARLEATHPRITLLMRNVIDSLSYLGI